MSIANDTELSQALNHLQTGNWDAAHAIVQRRDDRVACHIHAILHRIEGDNANAAYWYRQANVAMPSISTVLEIQALIDRITKE